MLAKQFFLLGFFTLITCAAFAQPVGVGVKLSPVPIWPKSGVIPIELQDRYVFLDPEAGELVLAYPEERRQCRVRGWLGSTASKAHRSGKSSGGINIY